MFHVTREVLVVTNMVSGELSPIIGYLQLAIVRIRYLATKRARLLKVEPSKITKHSFLVTL